MSPDRLEQIQALYLAALGLPASERTAFLDDACADDEALRREVASLLEAGADADSFLEHPLADVRTLATGVPEGQRIGPYRVLEEIGRGGMGRVYLAERADGQFEQHVALKVIRRGFDTDEIVRRFLQERQILARLEHPHIARLYDGGIDDAGRPYFAMEHVAGEPLLAYCDQRTLGIEARLRLFQQVGEAVQFAHRNLVVHRDLKPGNVLVTEGGTDRRPSVKLLDFGIAKVLTDEASTAASNALTQTGARVLTPEYAAPEQIAGDPVTTATDVYSLGVVLYELLTGHRPYAVERATPTALERAILEAEPARPSTVVTRTQEHRRHDGTTEVITPEQVSRARAMDPSRLRRRLAGDLDTIILKALRKEPERRYASVEAFVDDLRRYLAGLPIDARPDTAGYRLRKFVRRHRPSVIAGTTLVLLLIGFVVLHTVRVTAERNRAEQAATQARLEAQKAEAVKDFLVSVFRVSDPDESRGATVTAQELLDEGAARIDNELTDQPQIQAEMMAVMGDVYQQLGLFDQAEPLLEQALTLERTLATSDSTHVADALNRLALLRYNQGNFEEAIRLLRRTLALREAQPDSDPAAIAEAQNHLATLLLENGALEPADSLLRLALATRRTLDRPADLAASLNTLALLLVDQGRYEEAEPFYQEALALQRGYLDPDHPDLAETTYNLAQLYWSRGDLDAAEPLFREVLATSRRVYGHDHSDVALDLNSLGLVLMDKGAFDDAEAAYREALSIQHNALGKEHPDYTATLYNLGSVHFLTGQYAPAEAMLRQALALDRRLFGSDHPNLAIDMTRLAAVLRAQGAHAEATSLLNEALTTFRAIYPEHHHRIASVKIRLGQIAFDQKRYDEAEALLHQALTDTDASFTTSWKTAEAQSTLGRCLLALGRPSEAEPLLTEALTTLQEIFPPEHTVVQATRRAVAAAHNAQQNDEHAE